MPFSKLTSSQPVLRAIEELGWKEPTPIQAQGIPVVRQGRDIVGIAQTGTGKTGSFLIPALEKHGDREQLTTLVVCPTRELAQQVAEDARAVSKYMHLFVGELVGGLPIRAQIRDLRAGFDIVVATPGRLIDHIERGTIEVELAVLDAPLTCDSFTALAGKGFFNGLVIHRVVPNFVVQGGDPRGDGWGGPGYALRSEFSPARYERGTIGIASAGKDTEGSQFFITHSPQPHLDGRYTVVGRVLEGMDVVDRIQAGDWIERLSPAPAPDAQTH